MPNYLNTPVNTKEPALGTDPGDARHPLPVPARVTTSRTATAASRAPSPATSRAPSWPTRRRRTSPSPRATRCIYGHGLLGGQSEVNSGAAVGDGQRAHGRVYCATDWYGMATGDVPNVATMLTDMSQVPDARRPGPAGDAGAAVPGAPAEGPARVRDRRRRSGPARAACSSPTRSPTTATARAASSAARSWRVAQDITAGVLGVPAMNYSTLLDRSHRLRDLRVESSTRSYPSEVDRARSRSG